MRVATANPEPNATNHPAAASGMPMRTAPATANDARQPAAAAPQPTVAANSSIARSGAAPLDAAPPPLGAKLTGGTAAAVTAAIAAQKTNDHRQPTVSATSGTAMPPTSVAAGIADCLSASARPRRAGEIARVTYRLAAGWQSALQSPPRNKLATSVAKSGAAAIEIREKELSAAPRRSAAAGPMRSDSRPIGAELTTPAPK